MKSVKERHTTIKNYVNEKDSPQGKQYIIKCPNIQIGRGGILNMFAVIKSQCVSVLMCADRAVQKKQRLHVKWIHNQSKGYHLRLQFYLHKGGSRFRK